LNGVFPSKARQLLDEYPIDRVALQVRWLEDWKRINNMDEAGGFLVMAIKQNLNPPRGHPDERWYRATHPYAYLGEPIKTFNGPKAKGGARKVRRTANKGSVAGAVVIPGGLKFGDKHGPLKKDKEQNRGKYGLK
jgi:hypothetical protein